MGSLKNKIVSADEAAIIAAKLRAYARHVDAAQIAKLEKLYTERQKALLEATKQPGETVILGDEPLGLTVDSYREWIASWAAYNEVASHHAGYRIE